MKRRRYVFKISVLKKAQKKKNPQKKKDSVDKLNSKIRKLNRQLLAAKDDIIDSLEDQVRKLKEEKAEMKKTLEEKEEMIENYEKMQEKANGNIEFFAATNHYEREVSKMEIADKNREIAGLRERCRDYQRMLDIQHAG